jgi:hypothetical protein
MLKINLASVAAAINRSAHSPEEWEFESIELYEISQAGLQPYFTYKVIIRCELAGSHWNGMLFKVYVCNDGISTTAYWKQFIGIE